MTGFSQDGYVPVAQRIAEFYKKHPEGTLQSEVLVLEPDKVVIKAYAYRTADDQKPGIGHASETIPGSTPFTRGSEIENAETSAWGRAIAALGFEVKEGIATAEEVRNAQARQPAQNAPQRPAPRPVAPTPAPAQREPQRAATAPVQNLQPMTMREAMEALEGVEKRVIGDTGKAMFGTWSLKEMTPEQRAQLVAAIRGGEGSVPAAPPPPPSGDDLWEGMPAA